jgi:hypothetical protein
MRELQPADFAEWTEALDEYRREHPEIDQAMQIFQISDEAYQAALQAMYGPHVSWSDAANPSTT